MKVLHINSQDSGGAAIASISLHNSLKDKGIDSTYLALDNHYNFEGINYIFPKDTSKYNLNYLYKRHLIPQYFRRRFFNKILTSEHFSFPYSMIDITKLKLYKNADIIHFHNIAEFVDVPSFLKKNKKPIVVTLHDLYFLNGLLHIYELNKLNRFTKNLLEKYKKMMEQFAKFDIKIIAPSNSVKKAAFRINSLLTDKIEIIYHGIDTKKYYPSNNPKVSENFKIDKSKKVILIIADNFGRINKNFKNILDKIANSNLKNIHILAVGNNYIAIKNDKIDFTNLEYSQNYSMNEIYSAADITLVPSLFETFSLVTAESISCGTPVVSFDNSGPSEIINHLENGYLAKFEDYDDLIQGIDYCFDSFNKNSTKLDNEFTIEHSTNKYIEVYKSLLG